MKVTKVGNVYKVARITGPKHNFLGLTLSGAEVPSLTVERLQVDDGGVYAGTLDEQQLVEAVRRPLRPPGGKQCLERAADARVAKRRCGRSGDSG